jgi:hypothetical protein
MTFATGTSASNMRQEFQRILQPGESCCCRVNALQLSQIGAFLEQLHLYYYGIARRGSEKVNRNSDPPKAYYSNLELWHNMSYGCCECRVGAYRGQLGPKVGFRPRKYR